MGHDVHKATGGGEGLVQCPTLGVDSLQTGAVTTGVSIPVVPTFLQ